MSAPKRLLISFVAGLILEAVLAGLFMLTFNLEEASPPASLVFYLHQPVLSLFGAFGLEGYPALFSSLIVMAVVWTAVFFAIGSWRSQRHQSQAT